MSSWNPACYIRGLIPGIGRGVPNVRIADNLIIAIVFKCYVMELVSRLISDIEAAAPAILSLRFNMDAGSDPASEIPRKKVNNGGIFFLCIKSVEPKRRIKSQKQGAWNFCRYL